MTDAAHAAGHWDDAYRHGDTTRSWFQHEPRTSLQFIDAAALQPGSSLIDVGGGASNLVDALLDRGRADLTVLDISAAGLRTAQHRLGSRSAEVRWLVADLRTWTPNRTWNVWHDRAVFHFFTIAADRQRYLRALNAATDPGSHAILATFAPDGPHQCSGLPVARYDPGQLAALLGPHWQLVADTTKNHTTPAGNTQPFTWTRFLRQA